ncbi:hypothetical protein AB0K60_32820 [Thermopolyspora sp. NPDC052614]|uniref:hypothetical protein n=1 Tax=Thermopolyspora sp. NPDC052614 TaxID=3155682 RepID=UPI00342097F5
MSVDRRRARAAAVLGREPAPLGPVPGGDPAPGVVTGEIRDVSPHLLVVENAEGDEIRLVVAPWATAWCGSDMAPADVPRGARAIIRTAGGHGRVADRIWVDISRFTGKILKVRGTRDLTVDLDCGPHRGRRTIRIPYRASGRIQVRHPRLEPGYLFDAIGTLGRGEPTALLPAASQPAYRAEATPVPPLTDDGPASTHSSGPVSDPVSAPMYGAAPKISGSAVWSDVFDDDERGAAYPMLERADAECERAGTTCAPLPYLAMGSALAVDNVCTNRSAVVPIVACGCVAGRFCDRCVECGTSPRGRIVELSPASFVELGGELTRGCFNARIVLG